MYYVEIQEFSRFRCTLIYLACLELVSGSVSNQQITLEFDVARYWISEHDITSIKSTQNLLGVGMAIQMCVIW